MEPMLQSEHCASIKRQPSTRAGLPDLPWFKTGGRSFRGVGLLPPSPGRPVLLWSETGGRKFYAEPACSRQALPGLGSLWAWIGLSDPGGGQG